MLLQASCLFSKLFWFASTSLAWRWSEMCRVPRQGLTYSRAQSQGLCPRQGAHRRMLLLHSELTTTDGVCTVQLQWHAVGSTKSVLLHGVFLISPFCASWCQMVLCLEKLLLMLPHLSPCHNYCSPLLQQAMLNCVSFASGKEWNCKYTSDHNST